MEEPTAPPFQSPRRTFGWVLTVAVAFGWAAVVRESAWRACWPDTSLARAVEAFGLVLPFIIIGGGAIAMWRRSGEGSLLGYSLVLGALWLPHSDLMVSRTHNDWGKPHGVLKSMQTAQTLFRESDKDGDATLDYGTLTELIDQALINEAHAEYVLRDQPLRGYRYRVHVSPTTPEFLWAAVANPAEPDPLSPEMEHAVGYVANHEGLFAGIGPVEVDPTTCALPSNVHPYPKGSEELYRELRKRPVSHNRFWRYRAPFGFAGTLALFGLAFAYLTAWVFQLGPFQPQDSAPGEDHPASELA